MMNKVQKSAQEWLIARDIIAKVLQEFIPEWLDDTEHIAEVIIDNLAAHDPPITLLFGDEKAYASTCT